jgi:hypothetical protein
MEEKQKLKRQVFFKMPRLCRPLISGMKAIKQNSASLRLYNIRPEPIQKRIDN